MMADRPTEDMMGSRVIAVDVGGTFIDIVSIDRETGEVAVEKQPSTPERLADEVLMALGRLPGTPADIGRVLHGSTVAVNTLLQRTGAKVGLVTTRGFRDVLELARGNRPFIYDWVWVPPEPLVPRALRREVTERFGPRGEEIAPLDVEGLEREVAALVGDGAQAIAVCFLHAYANPKHEREAAEEIERRHPGLPVTVSSEIASEWHEYERTSTAVINAYVQPLFDASLGSLRGRLAEAGMKGAIGVMQSNGGVITVERAVDLPVRTLASGPAGGVIGVASLARALGHPDAICTDVGGTTYDVAIIEGGRVQERTETEIEGLPVLAPTVDVTSIGAGGGSIAWIDELGALRVGPKSAGADPGPACFGFGGEDPTVTDCHLVLRRLDAERFLGSRMLLDVAAAERAIAGTVGAPLGFDLDRAADGVLRIAETAMADAIHSMTVERGIDPRTFVLYAYGGGGGLFAAATALELDIGTIVVPRAPANFSAWGILTSEYREDASTTRVLRLDDGAMRTALAELDSLRVEVTERLADLRFTSDRIHLERRADLRFEGQEHTVTVEVDPAWGPGDADALRAAFVARHRQLYGHGDPEATVELVTVRCRGLVPGEDPCWPAWAVTTAADPRAERPVYFREAGGTVPTLIYDREALAVDQEIVGPSIVEEWTSTTLVPPGWVARVEPHGSLVLTRSEAS
jgi:N-methylhydantoinase A